MTKFLEKQLIAEYPDYFVEMYGEPEKTCMHHGIQCNDGWFNTIRNTCVMLKMAIESGAFKFTRIAKESETLQIDYDFDGPEEVKLKVSGIINAAKEGARSISEITGLAQLT